jgi:hypothetical protein
MRRKNRQDREDLEATHDPRLITLDLLPVTRDPFRLVIWPERGPARGLVMATLPGWMAV